MSVKIMAFAVLGIFVLLVVAVAVDFASSIPTVVGPEMSSIIKKKGRHTLLTYGGKTYKYSQKYGFEALGLQKEQITFEPRPFVCWPTKEIGTSIGIPFPFTGGFTCRPAPKSQNARIFSGITFYRIS